MHFLGFVWQAFDTDLSGTVSYEEFTLGLSKMTKGTTSQKLELLFQVYDKDQV